LIPGRPKDLRYDYDRQDDLRGDRQKDGRDDRHKDRRYDRQEDLRDRRHCRSAGL